MSIVYRYLSDDMNEADKLVAGFPFDKGWSLALHILRKTHPYGDDIGLCRARLLKEVVLDEDSPDDDEDSPGKKVPEQLSKWQSVLSRPLGRQVASPPALLNDSVALSSSSSASLGPNHGTDLAVPDDGTVSPSSSSSSSSAEAPTDEVSSKRTRK
jgi:hypothetical protein